MNKLDFILTFCFGALAGAGGAILYLKQYYAKIADEEIESVKQAYGTKLDEVYKQFGEDTHKDISVEHNGETQTVDTVSESFIDESLKHLDPETKAIYDKIITDYTSYAAEPGNDEKLAPVRDVYEIDEELYSESNIHYDKRILHFFVDDHTIFDPENVEILQPDDSIGQGGVDIVLRDEDTYSHFFRDDRQNCDYEVVKVSGAYYDEGR